MKAKEKLEISKRMKQMLNEPIEIPEELDEMDNSNFVINDQTFKIQELFTFANETSDKLSKEKRRANFLEMQTHQAAQ